MPRPKTSPITRISIANCVVRRTACGETFMYDVLCELHKLATPGFVSFVEKTLGEDIDGPQEMAEALIKTAYPETSHENAEQVGDGRVRMRITHAISAPGFRHGPRPRASAGRRH